MKSKISIYILICIVSIISFGCEQNDWEDWRLQNELWLENNKNQSDIITTHTGLQYKVVSHPTTSERRPNATSNVYVDYKGTLIDGTQFDSGESAGFSLSSVIAGWTEGIQKMSVHDTYIFYIPYDLAYGEDGSGTEGSSSYIPPYSTLIFEVYLAGAVY